MGYLKQSLRLARQYRTCPPPEIVHAPEHKDSVERHFRQCPYCSTELYRMLDHFTQLTNELKAAGIAPAAPRDAPPQPGDLRLVSADLAGWRDGFFYSPPLVLVLERTERISDDLLVAQTYPDTVMAGPGDLILTKEQGGVGPLFVETWHTYTLKAAHLGPCTGHVSETVLAAVREMGDDPEKLPDWAPLTPPMIEDDPRIYFRSMEVESGYTFASRSVASLMAELESDADADDPAARLKELAPGVKWPEHLTDFDEIAASARFPDEYYLRAAADDDREWIWANLVVFRQGRVHTFRPIRVEILMKEPVADGWAVFCEIQDLPEGPEVRVQCYHYEETCRLEVAETVSWIEPNRQFIATFTDEAPPDARIAVALFRDL